MTTTPVTSPSPLVTTAWLAERLGRSDVAVVDGSYYIPTVKRDPAAEYAAGHIPGAVRFDIDEIADHSNPLPHMLPTADQFATAVGRLGISDSDTIVVYDGVGLGSAPRVWWTFRLFGAQNVFILEGGLPRWTAEGRPVESGPVARAPARFVARRPPAIVTDAAGVAEALVSGRAQVVDARPADRFRGDAPEFRPGLRSGHIPGSLNVPSGAVVENGALLPPDRLRQVFSENGVDIDRPVITTCGSGVTASTLWLALERLGKPPVALYDGSWSEWGGRADLPVATGPADRH